MTARPILLVDDDVDACQNLQEILVDLGYVVDVAHDGCVGLELAQRGDYGLAILDFKMPGMNGAALYRAIKQLGSGTHVLILTAYPDDELLQAALEWGPATVLSKPAQLPDLLERVAQSANQPLVLIVDDDDDLLATLTDIISPHGFSVVTARSMPDAIQVLSRQKPNVALLDLRIPKGDGEQLFRTLQSMCPETRAIYITGYRTEFEASVPALLSAGANAVCYKPLDVPELLATIHRLAGRPTSQTM